MKKSAYYCIKLSKYHESLREIELLLLLVYHLKYVVVKVIISDELENCFPFCTLFDKVIHCVEQFKMSVSVERIELY